MNEQIFEPMKPMPPEFRTMRAGDPRWDEWLQDGARKSALWMRTLEQGQIVHYTDGFGAWVRCEVVNHPLRVPGTVGHDPMVPSFVPLAMVGPQWPRDHQCTRDYWGDKIRHGISFQPNASFVYESPHFTDETDETGDPREMAVWTA